MKILFIQASGLGNSILLSPTLKHLRNARPDWTIDLYVYRANFAAPYRGSDVVDRIHVQSGFQTILQLRNASYDASVCAFPSNRWQYHLLNRIIGSRTRISHDYPVGYLRTFRFLETDLVEANPELHDVEQNLRLLQPLDVPSADPPDLQFHLDPVHRERATHFLRNHGLRKTHLIGVHPGSGPITWKRAPLSVFLKLVSKHARDNTRILVFGGPEENDVKKRCKQRLMQAGFNQCILVTKSVKLSAALIAECDLFISNDTGLSHVAAAVNVPSQITVFNGTDPGRTRPWRDDAQIVKLRPNRMTYPYVTTTTGLAHR